MHRVTRAMRWAGAMRRMTLMSSPPFSTRTGSRATSPRIEYKR
jgi:hypothetical protein